MILFFFGRLFFLALGTLGVITEVSLKIRPIPPVRKYASFVFPDFETGIRFMREVARQVNSLLFHHEIKAGRQITQVYWSAGK